MVSLITRHDEIDRLARLERDDDGSADIRHYFYTQNWQCVEERAAADDSDVPAPEDLDPDIQYVWGLRYIDDLVLRDRDTSTPKNGTLNERLYAMQDANWNVVALADSDGDVVERYLYSAYGDPLVLNADFAEDSDGTDYAWEFRFTGRRTDLETDLMYYRNRMYHPGLGRFVARDPVGYEGSDVNLYRYARGMPSRATDPKGEDLDDWTVVGGGTYRDLIARSLLCGHFATEPLLHWTGDMTCPQTIPGTKWWQFVYREEHVIYGPPCNELTSTYTPTCMFCFDMGCAKSLPADDRCGRMQCILSIPELRTKKTTRRCCNGKWAEVTVTIVVRLPMCLCTRLAII